LAFTTITIIIIKEISNSRGARVTKKIIKEINIKKSRVKVARTSL